MDIKSTLFNWNDSNCKDNTLAAQMQPEISGKEKDLENPTEKISQMSQSNEQETNIFLEIRDQNNLEGTLKSQYELNNHINFVKFTQIAQKSNKFIFLFEKQNHLLHDFLSTNEINFLTRLILFKQCFEIIKILKTLCREKFKFFNMMHFFIDENTFHANKTPILKLLYNGKIFF